MNCEANQGSTTLLMALLRTYQPDITTAQVLALDIEVDPAMEQPLILIIATSLLVVWTQRQEEAMSNVKFRAELKTRCKFLEQCNYKNVMTMTSLALEICSPNSSINCPCSRHPDSIGTCRLLRSLLFREENAYIASLPPVKEESKVPVNY